MFGFYNLQLPSSWQTRVSELSNRQRGGTLTGAAVMGLLSALIVGPCMAAPRAGALIYIGESGDAVLGGAALFAMSLGMGVPLLAIGASAGRWLTKERGWMTTIKAVFGVLLLAMAIWMLDRIIPPQARSRCGARCWSSLPCIGVRWAGCGPRPAAGASGAWARAA